MQKPPQPSPVALIAVCYQQCTRSNDSPRHVHCWIIIHQLPQSDALPHPFVLWICRIRRGSGFALRTFIAHERKSCRSSWYYFWPWLHVRSIVVRIAGVRVTVSKVETRNCHETWTSCALSSFYPHGVRFVLPKLSIHLT